MRLVGKLCDDFFCLTKKTKRLSSSNYQPGIAVDTVPTWYYKVLLLRVHRYQVQILLIFLAQPRSGFFGQESEINHEHQRMKTRLVGLVAAHILTWYCSTKIELKIDTGKSCYCTCVALFFSLEGAVPYLACHECSSHPFLAKQLIVVLLKGKPPDRTAMPPVEHIQTSASLFCEDFLFL